MVWKMIFLFQGCILMFRLEVKYPKHYMGCSWNPKHLVLNGCLVISNRFSSKGLVHHPIERTTKIWLFRVKWAMTKEAPVCLGYVSGMKYYLLMWGWFHKPWHEDPVIKQPVFHGSSIRPFFFFYHGSKCCFWVNRCCKMHKIWSNYSDLTWPGPPKGSYEREMGPLISGSSRFPWKPSKNHPFFLVPRFGLGEGGKFCCPGFGEVSLAEICESSSLHSRRCRPVGEFGAGGHFKATTLEDSSKAGRLSGYRITPQFWYVSPCFFLGHKKGRGRLTTTRITIAN